LLFVNFDLKLDYIDIYNFLKVVKSRNSVRVFTRQRLIKIFGKVTAE